MHESDVAHSRFVTEMQSEYLSMVNCCAQSCESCALTKHSQDGKLGSALGAACQTLFLRIHCDTHGYRVEEQGVRRQTLQALDDFAADNTST